MKPNEWAAQAIAEALTSSSITPCLPVINAVTNVIEKAVAEERERCAKIADSEQREWDQNASDPQTRIARKIRELPETNIVDSEEIAKVREEVGAVTIPWGVAMTMEGFGRSCLFDRGDVVKFNYRLWIVWSHHVSIDGAGMYVLYRPNGCAISGVLWKDITLVKKCVGK